MLPLLKLVTPETAMPPDVVDASTIEPCVLTYAFSARLARVTRAERELRAMGLRALDVTWAPKPVLHLHCDPAMSMKPLMDRLTTRRFVRDGRDTDVYGDFCDVTVWWRIPASDHTPVQSLPSTSEH